MKLIPGPISTLRTLAAAAFDFAAEFTKPPADRLWEDAKRACAERAADELAEREAAEEVAEPPGCKGFQWVGQHLDHCAGCGQPYWEHRYTERPTADSGPFDDICSYQPISEEQRERVRLRYMGHTSATPGAFATPVEKADRPASPPPSPAFPNGDAGHPIFDLRPLRAAARGLRMWADGEHCEYPHYWRSIANSLDALAQTLK